MFFRRLYIKWKIWRLKNEISSIPSQLNFYWINLNTLNIKYHDGKLNVEDIYKLFIKQQVDKKKRLEEDLKKLKNNLANL